jgi:DNA-binding GntR family transcriptional regulator
MPEGETFGLWGEWLFHRTGLSGACLARPASFAMVSLARATGRSRPAPQPAHSEEEIRRAAPVLDTPQVLSERVYRAVLQMLARGSLRRGATLRIGALSKALGVSPTPVREALARLAATGLIMHEARKGYRIAPPLNGEQIRQLMDARRLIEVAAIDHACRAGGEAFRTSLAAALAAQEAAVNALHSAAPANKTERSALEWRVLGADLHFHQVIFDHTHNRFIRVMADSLSAQLHRVRQSAEQGLFDDLQALAEHKTILEAVLSGDVAAAKETMFRHMNLVEQRSAADLELARSEAGVPPGIRAGDEGPGQGDPA